MKRFLNILAVSSMLVMLFPINISAQEIESDMNEKVEVNNEETGESEVYNTVLDVDQIDKPTRDSNRSYTAGVEVYIDL